MSAESVRQGLYYALNALAFLAHTFRLSKKTEILSRKFGDPLQSVLEAQKKIPTISPPTVLTETQKKSYIFQKRWLILLEGCAVILKWVKAVKDLPKLHEPGEGLQGFVKNLRDFVKNECENVIDEFVWVVGKSVSLLSTSKAIWEQLWKIKTKQSNNELRMGPFQIFLIFFQKLQLLFIIATKAKDSAPSLDDLINAPVRAYEHLVKLFKDQDYKHAIYRVVFMLANANELREVLLKRLVPNLILLPVVNLMLPSRAVEWAKGKSKKTGTDLFFKFILTNETFGKKFPKTFLGRHLLAMLQICYAIFDIGIVLLGFGDFPLIDALIHVGPESIRESHAAALETANKKSNFHESQYKTENKRNARFLQIIKFLIWERKRHVAQSNGKDVLIQFLVGKWREQEELMPRLPPSALFSNGEFSKFPLTADPQLSMPSEANKDAFIQFLLRKLQEQDEELTRLQQAGFVHGKWSTVRGQLLQAYSPNRLSPREAHSPSAASETSESGDDRTPSLSPRDVTYPQSELMPIRRIGNSTSLDTGLNVARGRVRAMSSQRLSPGISDEQLHQAESAGEELVIQLNGESLGLASAASPATNVSRAVRS